MSGTSNVQDRLEIDFLNLSFTPLSTGNLVFGPVLLVVQVLQVPQMIVMVLLLLPRRRESALVVPAGERVMTAGIVLTNPEHSRVVSNHSLAFL